MNNGNRSLSWSLIIVIIRIVFIIIFGSTTVGPLCHEFKSIEQSEGKLIISY